MADIAVIGAGVVGCATALELAKRGAAVTIIERDGIASHASGFSYGGLYPTMGSGIPGPVLGPARRSLALHREKYGPLRESTGIDYELRPVESLGLAGDDRTLAALDAERAWQRSEGFDAELVPARQLYALEPSLAKGLAGALLQRSHWELDSYRFTLALAQAAEKQGAVIVSAEAAGLVEKSGAVAGVRTRAGAVIPASAVVIASGPWAGTPPEVRGAWPDTVPLPALPVRPVKGEILRLRLPGDSFMRRCGMNGRNVGRKPDGMVWAGTTEWERGFDSTPTVEGRDSIMFGALKYAPLLANAVLVEHTACLRPLAADGLPIIGRASQLQGVFVAAAAGKKGVLLSLAMAKMTSGLVVGPEDGWSVPPELSAARFSRQ